MKELILKNVKIGRGNPLALIAGPCVLEDEAVVMRTAEQVKKISEKLKIGLVFKSSYKKDNRSSAKSYQGPGLEKGLKILEKVKKQFDVPVLSDVHYPEEVAACAQVLDIIQIPAYLCMQTELTLRVAKTGKVVNIKKGQFLAPEDMGHIVKKIEETGNTNILLTERGSCFGYHNLVVDFKALPIMRSLGYPVVFDVTHTIRKYGKPSSDPAGGSPEFIEPLARAGVACGCDAIFIETHPRPCEAKCDAASMLELSKLERLLESLMELDQVARKYV
ncbi:MAG: 3-deoxy-8-phosphooctulonate synthase [Candidatus Edwardsbacteria bacterium RIFOXYD12_FULL_50_11]|uniref:3-deoxy-8-phosphooctulonate synthase n=1 Tax=Candidatus Edwardsbacteria bacterium GWF2_54_11 TaxID=1817851 RepID=A0A1F5RGD4_9BACT|nr:MAG: 3-deoxy-8-phosphooctulonate synthase [Candidatus Edwardsbacteria bacterium RifOxyC12_full_54_24]OGF06063.1 MAG: 3-deoxy-8-phosphooctulonate synthase [Candidatus Edwardsbacteria bacterium RifOxyA12_full_54_48]OGF11870.1 MAG: 3-deoxy-8-phosphooctulonate synthase [Candidatus Edwardsbacteria bacterium GWE2_54_12]OGF13499.1 MAG: 3-deoxy-8-phosphooctulonate synthase [Candidatus Edwardsbacteria bacterium GWF2_54_11]OGF17104.1 MAG: 3-deoxy-8-phosphooctulonate synthase [Candidatus Edwardsbacteri